MVDPNKNKLIITNAKLCLGHEIEYELTVVDDICPIALNRIRLIKSFFFRSGGTVSHHNLVPVAITYSSLPRADLCRLPAPCVSILYEQFNFSALFFWTLLLRLWDRSALMLDLPPEAAVPP